MRANAFVSSLHILAAIILWVDAAIHFFVHPLDVRPSTISILLASFGSSLLIQELSTLASGRTRCKLRMLSSYLSRAIFFLLTAAIIFDRLADAPCDVQLASSPYQSSPAKFSLSPGGTSRNITASSEQPILAKQGHPKGPPGLGTAFYLAGALAPRCVQVENIPGVPEGSVAWVNVGANRRSWCLVLSACACTLVVSALYFVLAILYGSGKVKLTPSMECAKLQCEPRLAQGIECTPSMVGIECTPSMVIGEQSGKKVGPYSSTYVVDLYPDERYGGHPTAGLYQQQALSYPNRRSVSPNTGTTTTRPSTRRQRSTSTTHQLEFTLDPRQGTASTPDQIFRIERIDTGPVSARANSDTRPYPFPVTPTIGTGQYAAQPGEAQRGGKYGYGQGYDRTVDLASGCIMHYPLFSKKKREAPTPLVFYPTLAPPDFSRSSLESPVGLTPRTAGKGRLSASSKAIVGDTQKKLNEDQFTASAPELAIAVTSSTSQAHDEVQATTKAAAISSTVPSSPSGIDFPALTSTSAKAPSTSAKSHRLAPYTHQHRLGTAESSRSVLSNLSSRPGTGQSTKSANSFRLMRRRRGLFAALDLHLGGSSRLSAVSGGEFDCTFDSGRSCSAGTFGDGVGISGDSPLNTPKPQAPPCPLAAQERSLSET